MDGEVLDMNRFENLGIVKSSLNFDGNKLDLFLSEIEKMKVAYTWDKSEIVTLFHNLISGFEHKETGKYLDSKM